MYSGEVEIELKKNKKISSLNTQDPSDRRDHVYQFRRSISAPYIFGVEELVSRVPNGQRIFDVIVKSIDCSYFLLPLVVKTRVHTEYRRRALKTKQ